MGLRVVTQDTAEAPPDIRDLFDEAGVALRRLVVAYRTALREVDPADFDDPRIGGIADYSWSAIAAADKLFARYSDDPRGGAA